MATFELSPLAAASRDLVVRLAPGADPAEIESGCRDLLSKNTNGLSRVDTKVVEVAREIMRGVLSGAAALRSPAISAAMRGVSDSGDAGDAERLEISEHVCADIRDSREASRSDYRAAVEGAAPAARMTPDQLHQRLKQSRLDQKSSG